MFTVLYFFSQRIYKIDYQWKPIFRAAILTIVIYLINIYIPDYFKMSYIYTLILEIISILLVFLLLMGRKSVELVKPYFLKRKTT
jgi:hypothetical protein